MLCARFIILRSWDRSPVWAPDKIFVTDFFSSYYNITKLKGSDQLDWSFIHSIYLVIYLYITNWSYYYTPPSLPKVGRKTLRN